MGDSIVAGFLFLAVTYYLTKRHLETQLIWVAIIALFSHFVGHLSLTLSIFAGVAGVYFLSMSTRENFEEGEEQPTKHKKTEPKPSSATGKAHVDLGSTILHAYRNLSPEHLSGFRKDTKELMELQKELMGSLSDMKPMLEQGGEMLATFSQFFGKNGLSAPMPDSE